MRWPLIALALVSFDCMGCERPRSPAPAAAPYNVLLISLDTVRQDLLGCYGNRPRHAPDVPITPALDRLAAEGVRMVDAYSSSAWTLPSHMSVFTGAPPLQHGVSTEGAELDIGFPTLAEVLRERGYRTVGIFSAPYLDGHWGFARGFDAYKPTYDTAVETASQRSAEIRAAVAQASAAGDWPRFEQLKQQQVTINHAVNEASQLAITSEQVASRAIADLETFAQGADPWLLFVHFFDAHCDYAPPAPFDVRFDPGYTGSFHARACMAGPQVGTPDPDRPGGLIRALSDRDLEHAYALYEGELAWIDTHVDRILRALDRLHLTERTLVVVFSDHGEEFFEHGGLGHRHTLYEEVMRTPLLLRLPGVLPAGAAVRGLVSGADVFPTILEILGVPHAASPGVRSFVPLARGGDATERSILGRTVIMYGGAVRVGAQMPIALRQIFVHDGFWSGSIKIQRTRSWPQFPTTLNAELAAILGREAAAQYEREQLRWIDLARSPHERESEYSTVFDAPAARTALARFRQQYRDVLEVRRARTGDTAVPDELREKLESLGYLDARGGPAFPEPNLVLPPPPEPSPL
jgi:arylsulfatase A-like enzyme